MICLSDILAVLCQGDEEIKTRQMKEAIFENKVKQNIQEEEASHLKWVLINHINDTEFCLAEASVNDVCKFTGA